MALNKTSKKVTETVVIDEDPNSKGVYPQKIGQLCVDKTAKVLYIALDMTNAGWGTYGTAL